MVERTLQRSTHVIVLHAQLVDRRKLAQPVRLVSGGFGQLHKEQRMLAANRLSLVERVELLDREFANGFEHDEARLAIGANDMAQQTVVEQRRQTIQDRGLRAKGCVQLIVTQSLALSPEHSLDRRQAA